jgi:hypothetical protein
VVVLVVSGKDVLRFVGRKAESGKGHWLAKSTGVLEVETNEFAQGHDWSAASGFGADETLLWPSVLRGSREWKHGKTRGSLSRTKGFGKMLGGI